MENSQLDAQTALLIANADEVEAETKRPDEPSLPPLEWMGKNLFGTGQGSPWAVLRATLLTAFSLYLGLWAYHKILNFIFSEGTNWDSVRINLRLLFTQAYPDENYLRVWITVGIVIVLAGLSLGLTKVGQGFSLKRIATWFISAGLLVVSGVLLRQPSVLTNADGETLLEPEIERVGFIATMVDRSPYILVALALIGFAAVRSARLSTEDARWATVPLAIGTAILVAVLLRRSPNDDDADPTDLLTESRQSFGDAMGDRVGWWIIGLVLMGIGAAIWFGMGDFRRRNTFVPAIPLGLAAVGAVVSTTWWYRWGNYTFATDEESGLGAFTYEPGELVATSTRNPWTILFFLLVVAYLVGRFFASTTSAGTVRALVNGSWLLAPFVTFWGILRGPVMDWGYVASVDLPLWLLFAFGGGALLWMLTRPGIGELGRIIAVLILAAAAFTWVAAFFGWFGMLQKIRISILLLGLAGLLAPNFIGEARQRLRLVYGWIGFITIVHILNTLINTPSSIEVPTEDFAGGFMVTVYVAIFTMIFSFPLGVLLALARTSRLPIFRVMSTVYIEAFRGVPLITMLFFFTVFVNLFLPEGMELSLFAAVCVAFILFSAAYLAENVRGGLQAIRRGQYEASDALGLTTVQRTLFIVLPQGLRVSIPPLVGQVIATFKETSLLAIVGVFDFLRMGRDVIPAQPEFLGIRKPALLFICVVYFIGSYAMSKYSQRLEKQLGVGER